MVFRYSIKCNTCSTPHTLRISVGHNNWQDHTFMCTECSEEIKVGMAVDFENITTDIQCLSNCEPTNKEGCIVNLNPEFVVSEDLIHKDHVFPWMHEVNKQFNLEKNAHSSFEFNGIKFTDVFLSLGGIQQITEEWIPLKKAWSLDINEKEDFSQKKIHEYFLEKNLKRDPSLIEWLFGFSHKFIASEFMKDFEILNKYCKDIYKKFTFEFEKFIDYYKKNLKKDHFYRYFELYSNYFKNFSEYSQALLYVKNKKEIPHKLQAASINFKKTKMFYGDAYENYTSNLVVLACINNIASGRSFDEFQSMKLNKYLTINKANRANPFKDVPELSIFASCLESTLRNASHHGAMKLEKGKIKYQSGGTGAEQTMTYTQYIEKCNQIALLSMVLFMNELVIVGIR